MARIKIDFGGVKEANALLRSANKALDEIENALQMLQKRLDPRIQMRYEIESKTKLCREDMQAAHRKNKSLCDVVNCAANLYWDNESRLCRGLPDNDFLMIKGGGRNETYC